MIISKTDTQGKITYVNREFCRISGYERKELLREPHRIIRHPDMPRGVFKLFWQTLQAGDEFNGFVKNRCKNGDYYWVFATVSPWYAADGKSLRGYFSARRIAKPKGINFFADIYRDMLAKEAGLSGSNAPATSMTYLLDICQQEGLNYDQLAVRYQTR